MNIPLIETPGSQWS